MTDPARKRQLEELDQVTLCARILCQARSELYVNMKFLDVSLSSLGFEADWARRDWGRRASDLLWAGLSAGPV